MLIDVLEVYFLSQPPPSRRAYYCSGRPLLTTPLSSSAGTPAISLVLVGAGGEKAVVVVGKTHKAGQDVSLLSAQFLAPLFNKRDALAESEQPT